VRDRANGKILKKLTTKLTTKLVNESWKIANMLNFCQGFRSNVLILVGPGI